MPGCEGRAELPGLGADMDFPGNREAIGTVRRGRLLLALTATAVAVSVTTGVVPASAHSRAWAWGLSDWGRLGNGVNTVIEGSEDVAFPGAVCAVGTEGRCPAGPFLEGVTAISAGGADSLALLSNGTVLAWGENESGQLGDGTDTGPGTCGVKGRVEVERITTKPCSSTPITVIGLSGVTAISAGGAYGLALLSDGTVMAWGKNNKGQLGDGNTKSTDVPVPVTGLSGVTAISAGAAHALALLSDGTVMAWGENESGQLGDGTTKNRDVPVPVSGLAGVSAVAAATGGSHSLALLSDGAVEAWGANGEGQLGDGSTENSDFPVGVSGLSGVAAVSAGGASSYALLNDGGVMSWGTNGGGQLGIGGRPDIELPGTEELGSSDVPVQVCAVGTDPVNVCRSGPFLSEASTVSAGGRFEMALLKTGVVGWGDDCFGDTEFPCEVTDLPFIPEATGGELGVAKLISAGDEHNLAFGPPLPTLAGVHSTVVLDGGGELVTITGTEFSEATAVRFGSVSAPSFTVNSESSITAVTPAEPTGIVPVTVTTPAGTTPAALGVFLHYIAAFPQPVVRRMKPAKGPAGGGTSVLITGTGFFGGSVAVHFGSTSAASVTVNEIPTSPETNSITAVTPPGTGDAAVTVTTLGGTSATTSKSTFKYGAPTVTGVSPDSGSTSGGATVTVTGTGFARGMTATTFKFGSTQATSIECSSTTTCTVVTPPANKPGTVDVRATVGKAKTKKNPPADEFTYH